MTIGGIRAWVITVMLMVLMMINFADKAVLGLAATSIRAEFGLTAQQYGTISSAFFLLFSISALVVGHLADRFSTRKVLIVLALIWSAAMLPVIGPAGFTVILLSRVVLGAAEGPAFGVAQHAVQKWFKDADRSMPTAWLTLASPLGVIVGAPVLAWLIATHGWRSAFVAVAVVGVVWSALWLVIGRDGPIDAPATADATSAATESVRPLDRVHVPLRKILGSRTWIGCALSAFAGYWAIALLIAWVPAFLTDDLGYSKATAGTLTALPWIVGVIALLAQGFGSQRLMKGGVSSRWARGVLPGSIAVVAGVCILLSAVVHGHAMILGLLALGLGMCGVAFAAGAVACGEIAPVRQRGVVLGAFVGFYSLAGVIAPFVAGVLVDRAGSDPSSGYTVVFALTGVFVIVGGLLAVTLISPERDTARLTATGRPAA
ncbi:putative major facilitator superfamily transporter [Gordonia rhizosphera NBRC 16068]|uniref:Putative major facilitator superfamily transporter n=2 Tax=Gordonia rhizosphera TaxID=83341 RepID=K6VWU3_9ACTN|nr:putative major facilitator superfamily transporter [Gordonia rhizosphera NBRC 16068]